jgi:GT2 family glycosyltransferase
MDELYNILPPKIDIIIPSLRETQEYLICCLDSIIENKRFKTTMTYVWCNGYTQEDLSKLQEKYAHNDGIWIQGSEENRGQCDPVNQIAELYSSGNYIYIANDDMVFPPNFDKMIFDAYESYSYIWRTEKIVVCPKIIEPSGQRKLPFHYLEQPFGSNPKEFKKDDFYAYCVNNKDLGDQHFYPLPKLNFPLFTIKYLWFAIGGFDSLLKYGAKCDDDIYQKCRYLGIHQLQIPFVYVYHFGSKGTIYNPILTDEWKKYSDINNDIVYMKWSR